ncbi:MAG: ATP-binding cassette domain-containing protein, partial [Planctomycetaceae bacterium]|nr:ATP-binding cassette domain-containing protein [Planctomycetaceae bacterium]
MTQPLWKLEHVTLSGHLRPRLEDVSLQIAAGTTAVLGCSGAGKTSMLNLLVGLERPDAGSVSRNWAKTTDRPPIAWSPADGGLWPHLTVRQHLDAVTDDADDWLNLFDLTPLANAPPDRLSLGECSRLSLLRALASRPQVLVLDEPLVHVDTARVRRYWDEVSRVCHEGDISVVFALHDPELILRQAEHVICLDDGRCQWQGSATDLYSSPPTESLGWLLGPLNWFGADETTAWLEREAPTAISLRPEQLSI